MLNIHSTTALEVRENLYGSYSAYIDGQAIHAVANEFGDVSYSRSPGIGNSFPTEEEAARFLKQAVRVTLLGTQHVPRHVVRYKLEDLV